MLPNSTNVTQILRALLFVYVILTFNTNSVTAVFEGCDFNYQISPGYTYSLKSPNYPNSYNPGSSCRYRYTAPKNYAVIVSCEINLNKGASGCTTESFYIAVDGDQNLRGSEKLCGRGSFTRHSVFDSLVLAYISEGSVGNFICTVRANPKPCECGWSISKNIANGEEAAINEFPSIVALKTKGQHSRVFCSAIIITDRYMLTSAHCALFYDLKDIVAWVGRHNLESTTDTKYAKFYYIDKKIIHAGYRPLTAENDISLLQTTTDITFSRGVGPICLPPWSNVNNDFSWQNVDIAGWGTTKFAGPVSKTLQKITVSTTDYQTCENIYKDYTTIHTNQICTRDSLGTGKDSCQFDSGGPVIFRHKGIQYLIGVINFGKGCGLFNNPTGLNTRVTSYLQWIYDNTGHSICTIEM